MTGYRQWGNEAAPSIFQAGRFHSPSGVVLLIFLQGIPEEPDALRISVVNRYILVKANVYIKAACGADLPVFA